MSRFISPKQAQIRLLRIYFRRDHLRNKGLSSVGGLSCIPTKEAELGALDVLISIGVKNRSLILVSLGLNKLNATREVEATPQILGMVRKVEHMIAVEELA